VCSSDPGGGAGAGRGEGGPHVRHRRGEGHHLLRERDAPGRGVGPVPPDHVEHREGRRQGPRVVGPSGAGKPGGGRRGTSRSWWGRGGTNNSGMHPGRSRTCMARYRSRQWLKSSGYADGSCGVGLNTRANHTARLYEFGLIVVASLAPFFWRVLVGAGDLPAGDAWAYERIFATYHSTGQVRLVGWNDITLVGVLPVTSLWVAIVGFGHHQLHLLGSVMCAVAMLGVQSLLVTFNVTRRLPALLLFAGFTGFVGIAGTYLSDTFAIAGAVWAVALACRVAYPRNRGWPQWASRSVGRPRRVRVDGLGGPVRAQA